MISYDLIVIGGGPAGIGAAIAAKKKGIEKVLVIEREEELGGRLRDAEYIVSKKTGRTGEEYRKALIEQLAQYDIEVRVKSTVLKIEDDNKVACICSRKGIEKLQAGKILIATGAREKRRNPSSIAGDRVSGIYSVSMAYKILKAADKKLGSKILIIGSTEISRIAGALKQMNYNVVAVAGEDIEPIRHLELCQQYYEGYNLAAVYGSDRLEQAIICSESEEMTVDCDAVILADPLVCDGSLAIKSDIKLSAFEGPEINASFETSKQGVYACGRCVKSDQTMEEIFTAAMQVAEGMAKSL